MTETYSARDWTSQPLLIHPDYKSTVLRGPTKKPLPLERTRRGTPLCNQPMEPGICHRIGSIRRGRGSSAHRCTITRPRAEAENVERPGGNPGVRSFKTV